MTAVSILTHLSTLADSIRSRLLLVLERRELTVTELCAVLQLPQSTASRHLKTLGDDGWVVSRRDGTSRLYRMALDDLDVPVRRLWLVIREQLAVSTVAAQDDRRLKGVLARRRTRSEEFFSSAAGRWDKVRDELFGRYFHVHALLGLLGGQWVIGDLGCGTGQVAESLAPFVHRVIAVDDSVAMLRAARRRLSGVSNVDIRRGALEALPVDDGELDGATLFLVLHHLAEPVRVLVEAARVVRPGGRVLIVDMAPHERVEYQQQMGHVWLGFSSHQITGYLEAAGLTCHRVHSLPPDAAAKGPTLFVAVATRPRQEAPADHRSAPSASDHRVMTLTQTTPQESAGLTTRSEP